MIAHLSGKIFSITDKSVVIDVNGVGYKVIINDYTRGKIAGKEMIHLYIYTHVREDAFILYGFQDNSELELFELLISVSGVGPKAALGILSITDTNTLISAITHKDILVITKAPGIGKKTAERLILELGTKIKKLKGISTEDHRQLTEDQEVLDALAAMGYVPHEVRDVLQTIPQDITDIGEKIKYILKNKSLRS